MIKRKLERGEVAADEYGNENNNREYGFGTHRQRPESVAGTRAGVPRAQGSATELLGHRRGHEPVVRIS